MIIFWGEIYKSEKMCQSPPPLSNFFRGDAAVARHIALPKQTPWHHPDKMYDHLLKIDWSTEENGRLLYL